MPDVIRRVYFYVAVMVALVAMVSANCSFGQCFQSNQCGASLSQPQFDVNLPCAVQAVSAVSACRASGGRFLGCVAEGFGAYLSCNGGLARQRRFARSQYVRSYRRHGAFATCF